MKLFILILFVAQAAWSSPDFVDTGADYTPDCNYLGSLPTHICLDNLWYLARQMEVEKMNVPGRNLIKIKLYWGLGECRENRASQFQSSTLKFFPKNAWALEPNAILKSTLPSVLKAGTHVEIVDDNIQSVATLIMDRDVLARELAEKDLSVKVEYLLSGLYAGFYYKKYKFIRVRYHFTLEEGGEISINAKTF